MSWCVAGHQWDQYVPPQPVLDPRFSEFRLSVISGTSLQHWCPNFQKHKNASRWSVFNGSSDFLQINGSIGFNASLYVCFQCSFTKRKPFLLPNWLHWLKHVQDFNLSEGKRLRRQLKSWKYIPMKSRLLTTQKDSLQHNKGWSAFNQKTSS